jgi:alkanesulfonate monooxygenase SsuD/methylene tetrahydromethanopterin reductase-like flavin-dependent oxidoreductase (luciferase family)
MRIGVNLGPTEDWPAILAAAQMADANGFDALSFLDHYHATKLEWPYLCGWSLYGALAMVTSRIHLVPMVIDRLNYLPGVLAKEASTLSILSAGRFELGIGAGDFFEEAQAWGLTRWEQLGVERAFLTFWHPFDTLARAIELLA